MVNATILKIVNNKHTFKNSQLKTLNGGEI